MNVSMLDCLSSSHPTIDANIETSDVGIGLQESHPKIAQSSNAVTLLGIVEFEVVRQVPFGYNQKVALGYRVRVQESHHRAEITDVPCATTDYAAKGTWGVRGASALTAHSH